MQNIFRSSLRKQFTYSHFKSGFFFQAQGDAVSFESLSEDPPPLLFEPVVAEIENEDDNKYIFKMKQECSQDQLDYCAGKKHKSRDHSMCRYCVST